jgi:uncharacterized membrane protein YphA (DoxX/SURF4 family)
MALRAGVGLMFVITGAAHFFPTAVVASSAQQPSWLHRDGAAGILPRSGLFVTATGALKLVGSAGLLFPFSARTSAACLALLMVIMLTANISAASRRSQTVSGRAVATLPIRTALQCILVAAAGWTQWWPHVISWTL